MNMREIREAVRSELKQANLNAHRAAVDAGLPPDAIRYLLDGREPRAGRLVDICDALGLDLSVGPRRHTEKQSVPSTASENAVVEAVREEVRALKDELRRDLRDEPHALSDDPAGTRSVQMIEVGAAAGGGSCDLDNAPVRGPVWFRRSWMDVRGIDPTRAVVISVVGDSMEPTLPSGCKILVDRERCDRRAGRIYVVAAPDGLLVKRLELDEDGAWVLVSDSDSPEWADAPWPPEAEIVGEVRWMARELP